MATTTGAKKAYKGGCHCGFFRYTVELDLSEMKASRCNCSICLKLNMVMVKADPEGFKLEAPASIDEAKDYLFGTKKFHHYFCPTCGVHCYGVGEYTFEGKTFNHASVNVVTLDQDQVDLRKLKLVYWDGKGDNWAAGTKDEPFEGGIH